MNTINCQQTLVEDYINKKNSLYAEKYKLLRQLHDVNNFLVEVEDYLETHCVHVRIPDPDYRGHQTEWICKKCGL